MRGCNVPQAPLPASKAGAVSYTHLDVYKRQEKNMCDLIYSASTFHWIPEKIGYEKVFEMLRSGGVFARFANHPYKDKGREDIHEALQKLYEV